MHGKRPAQAMLSSFVWLISNANARGQRRGDGLDIARPLVICGKGVNFAFPVSSRHPASLRDVPSVLVDNIQFSMTESLRGNLVKLTFCPISLMNEA
jgi:hypothetical protein